jgi:hypothetical protein
MLHVDSHSNYTPIHTLQTVKHTTQQRRRPILIIISAHHAPTSSHSNIFNTQYQLLTQCCIHAARQLIFTSYYTPIHTVWTEKHTTQLRRRPILIAISANHSPTTSHSNIFNKQHQLLTQCCIIAARRLTFKLYPNTYLMNREAHDPTAPSSHPHRYQCPSCAYIIA